jgi:metal-responsive CopG/Arc/MetJ family transcriptional regulator
MQIVMLMKRFTISIPEDLKKEMDSLSDINWPQVAKESIQKKIQMLDEFECFERNYEE